MGGGKTCSKDEKKYLFLVQYLFSFTWIESRLNNKSIQSLLPSSVVNAAIELGPSFEAMWDVMYKILTSNGAKRLMGILLE
jgi:hypothetical protein